jgi:SAM-dependent methyltransferase
MEPKSIRRSKCRLCDSDRLELVVPLAPTPVAEKYVSREDLDKSTMMFPLDLYMCRGCGHVQMVDVVDPAYLFDGYTYESGRTKRILDHFNEIAERTVSQYKVAAESLVIDMGSNDGSLLRQFKERGMRVLGIDPAREIARKATAAGITTVAEFMSRDLARRIKQEHGTAAVVCAFNVFAHTDDLAGMTDSVRELLDPAGVFVVEASYLLDIIERMLLGAIFHEHVSHHSIIPLVPFLQRHGLELLDVERNSIQGGSIVGSAGVAGGPHQSSPSVSELIALERDRNLQHPETLQQFAAKLTMMRQQVGDLVASIQTEGKTIWGYGAARSGTTLIAQMNLGKIISHIVDDSPEKQHRFTPGDHIPVLPTEELYRHMPDYCFILAWIHARPIIQSNRAYLEKGGHFIVCVPQLQVIGLDYFEQ